ncbi:MAG: hypothetical protein LUE98_00990 [Tannerellaceae bacterium]|nr:hypothetical protein [Tannerellaceae bacterium]
MNKCAYGKYRKKYPDIRNELKKQKRLTVISAILLVVAVGIFLIFPPLPLLILGSLIASLVFAILSVIQKRTIAGFFLLIINAGLLFLIIYPLGRSMYEDKRGRVEQEDKIGFIMSNELSDELLAMAKKSRKNIWKVYWQKIKMLSVPEPDLFMRL